MKDIAVILVTGGAGYIGSHAVRQLIHDGRHVVVIDNLLRGHREAVHPRAAFYQMDLTDTSSLEQLMRRHEIDCVLHFAALAEVGESVADPVKYFRNNTGGLISLLDAMKRTGVNRMVFSSTCATYGIPDRIPIPVTASQQPVSPYGWSKLFCEQILRCYVKANAEFSFATLRYFNVAGCALDGGLGEDHDPETHLIPIVLNVALNRSSHVTVFGTEYPTPDGTCIRDYIHVEDLCAAHLAAMESLKPGNSRFYNLGLGKGYSVKQIIESASRITGCDIPVKHGNKRPGDVPTLIANPLKAMQEFGWSPKITQLDDIIASAWNWFRLNPNGYSGIAGSPRLHSPSGMRT